MIKSRLISTKDLLDDSFFSFEVIKDCKALVWDFAFQSNGFKDGCINSLFHFFSTTDVNQSFIFEQMFPEKLLICLNQFLNIHLFRWVFTTLGKFDLNNSLFLIFFEILLEIIIMILVLDAIVKSHRNSFFRSLLGHVFDDATEWSDSTSIGDHD